MCLTIKGRKKGRRKLYWSNKTYVKSKKLKVFEATRSDNIFGAKDVTRKCRYEYAFAILIDVANRPKNVTIKITLFNADMKLLDIPKRNKEVIFRGVHSSGTYRSLGASFSAASIFKEDIRSSVTTQNTEALVSSKMLVAKKCLFCRVFEHGSFMA